MLLYTATSFYYSQVMNSVGSYTLIESPFPLTDPPLMSSGSGSGQPINLFSPSNNSVTIGGGLMLGDADSVNSPVYVEGLRAEILYGSPVEQLFFGLSHPNITLVSWSAITTLKPRN